jgi:hypothetical protein
MNKNEKLYREYRRFDVVDECLTNSGRGGLAKVVRDEFWTKAYANGTESAYMKSQPTRSLTISHTTLYQAKSIVLYAPGKEHGERIPLYSPKVKVAITKSVPESWTLAHVVSGYNRMKIVSDDESVEIPLQSDDLVCISADE